MAKYDQRKFNILLLTVGGKESLIFGSVGSIEGLDVGFAWV